MKSLAFPLILLLSFVLAGCNSDEWISLFDGESLEGWKASENSASWKIEEGAIVTAGERSHLFYDGEVLDHSFKNFEFMVDVKTIPGSNSGIYIHTEFQEEGWPSKGYECQVINSNNPVEPGDYMEHKMTGSIYAIRNVWKSPVPDNEWFNYRIVVQGKTIQTFINGMLAAEYTEPEEIYRSGGMEGRVLGGGGSCGVSARPRPPALPISAAFCLPTAKWPPLGRYWTASWYIRMLPPPWPPIATP